MSTPKIFFAVLGLGMMSFVVSSCNDNTTSVTPGQPASTPTATPTPTASPSPTVSPSPQVVVGTWLQVFEQRNCPFPECPARDGLSIRWDGSFFVGPANNPEMTGSITPQELDLLTNIADAVADQDLDVDATCFQLEHALGRSGLLLRITLGNNTTATVHSIDNVAELECFRGDQDLALQLTQVMDLLASKYALPPQPSPSPSISPSPSPSPSPSVSPSPSPSPSPSVSPTP